jgi:hypothetical protein
LAPSAAGADRGGAPARVGATLRCGRAGETHAATGQMALPAHLGQRSRLVNSTCHSRNSVMPINQHLHVGVVVRQNLRVYRDRLSVENGVAYVPEMTIFPEQ